MKRSGVADLPLHNGRVPEWLASRMTALGTAISEAVLYHYGPSALLSRLSDPCWFQAFGAVLGMDWHSSGITTSVLGALNQYFIAHNNSAYQSVLGTTPQREVGVHVSYAWGSR